ncbi:MAG: hypothetical protein II250_00955 [Agathobacter sp.]|nr:hypothetical protein [Agathobacter sp.]
MFGSKNKAYLEELQNLKEKLQSAERVVSGTAEGKGIYEANVSDIAESRNQMQADVKQIGENLSVISDLAGQNVEVEAALCNRISEAGQQMKLSEEAYETAVEHVRGQQEKFMALVEENKHFTTPSKYLSELPASLHNENKEHRKKLAQMSDFSKQMGVLALNAAIEAGRMGEAGMQFVGAAEEIRQYAGNYEDVVSEFRAELDASDKRISELEETIHHLVSLLKDNNMSTAKLLKSNEKSVKLLENPDILAFSDEVFQWKEQVVGLLNVDEEVLKAKERNRIQLEDIEGEIELQTQKQEEISSSFTKTMKQAKEYMSHKKRGE